MRDLNKDEVIGPVRTITTYEYEDKNLLILEVPAKPYDGVHSTNNRKTVYVNAATWRFPWLEKCTQEERDNEEIPNFSDDEMGVKDEPEETRICPPGMPAMMPQDHLGNTTADSNMPPGKPTPTPQETPTYLTTVAEPTPLTFADPTPPTYQVPTSTTPPEVQMPGTSTDTGLATPMLTPSGTAATDVPMPETGPDTHDQEVVS